MKEQQPSNPCPKLAKCGFLTKMGPGASTTVIQNMYCKKDYSKCSRYKLSITGLPVPDNLWPNGQKCKLCTDN